MGGCIRASGIFRLHWPLNSIIIIIIIIVLIIIIITVLINSHVQIELLDLALLRGLLFAVQIPRSGEWNFTATNFEHC